MNLKRLISKIARDERGDIEDVPGLVLVVPAVLFVLVAFVIVFGSYANATNQVQSAAFAAARDASLSGDSGSAGPHAIAAAQRSLADGNIDCSPLDVTVDTSGLDTALGVTGTVTATVTCTVTYKTFQWPGIPTESTITQTAVSPTDPYRERP